MNSRSLYRGPYVSLGVALLLAAFPLIALYQGSFLPYLQNNKTLADTFVVLPYFLLGISAFLSWKMNQLSIVFSSFIFAVCYLMMAPPLPPETLLVKARALSVLTPLTLLVVFWTPQGRLFGTAGLYMLSATVFSFGGLRMMLRSDPKAAAKLFEHQLPLHLDFWKLPDLSIVFFLIFTFVILRLKDKDLKRYGLSVFFCLPGLIYLLNRFAMQEAMEPHILAMFFTSIGMVCIYAMYQVYWQKIYIDQLTEIPNRRALDEALMRMGRIYAIVMVDIDHFKQFNDNYGHEEGDNVLRFVASHLATESGGRAYRYGGEEFCILYYTDADEAFPMVEEIRSSLEKKDFYIRAPRKKEDRPKKKPLTEAPRKVTVTVSMGLASPSQTAPTPEAVRKCADRALYEAKARGRNQSVVDIGEELEAASRAI